MGLGADWDVMGRRRGRGRWVMGRMGAVCRLGWGGAVQASRRERVRLWQGLARRLGSARVRCGKSGWCGQVPVRSVAAVGYGVARFVGRGWNGHGEVR